MVRYAICTMDRLFQGHSENFKHKSLGLLGDFTVKETEKWKAEQKSELTKKINILK